MEIFRSKCNAEAQTLHCFAHLHDDVGAVLPYLNTVLGGFSYINEPPALTLKSSGKLITVHSRKIAVNALQDEEQAEKIVSWLQREINSAWENRADIEPSVEGQKQPAMLEVLKLLPKTNCKECGEPTCMVFAVPGYRRSKRSHQLPCPVGREEGVSGELPLRVSFRLIR
jgi:ArsR family metal-binding transcriptional regulator